jgi:hypothetical protein
VLTFHEWFAMWRDAARPQPLASRLMQLFGPPGTPVVEAVRAQAETRP